MIKLYGFGESRSFRCLWALEEAGLPYEYICERCGGSASAQHPGYLQLNVQEKVPTLHNDGLVRLNPCDPPLYRALRPGIRSASQRQHGCLCPA